MSLLPASQYKHRLALPASHWFTGHYDAVRQFGKLEHTPLASEYPEMHPVHTQFGFISQLVQPKGQATHICNMFPCPAGHEPPQVEPLSNYPFKQATLELENVKIPAVFIGWL